MNETQIKGLTEPACYNHAIDVVRVVESDLSWILLTGDFAYKIKKPLDLYFLDAGSLEARLSLCQAEVQLNRRTYPELYLGVVAITVSQGMLRVDSDDGEVIEYAVKMQQFSADGTLDVIHDREGLNHQRLEQLAQQVYQLHRDAPVSGIETPFGEPNSLYTPAQLNFDQVRPLLTETRDLIQLAQLESWAHEYLRRLWPRFAERKDLGNIREIHGDLHLGNVVQTPSGALRLFDCLEYRAEFRWIDVISEVAFLTLDLEARGDFASAWHLLNRYLELSGDYHSLWVYPGYRAYRAMVRAKECLLSLNAPRLPGEAETPAIDRYRRYATLAEEATLVRPRVLLITLGLDSERRQILSHQLIDDFGVIRLRSDLERERLYGNQVDARPKTYRHLLDLAELSLRTGFPVICSGSFDQAADRERFRRLAESQGVLFGILTDEASAAQADLRGEELASTHLLPLDNESDMVQAVRDLGHAFGMRMRSHK